MPKKINPEVKRAVRLVTEHPQEYPSVTAAAEAVSKQLGLGRETVRRWMVHRALRDLHAREAVLATCYEKRHKGRTVHCSLSVGPVLTASGSGAPLR